MRLYLMILVSFVSAFSLLAEAEPVRAQGESHLTTQLKSIRAAHPVINADWKDAMDGVVFLTSETQSSFCEKAITEHEALGALNQAIELNRQLFRVCNAQDKVANAKGEVDVEARNCIDQTVRFFLLLNEYGARFTEKSPSFCD